MRGLARGTSSTNSRWLTIAVLGLAVLPSVDCATLARGTQPTQSVLVTSTPSGAEVFVGSDRVGVTPVRLDLKRRDSRIVLRFEKAGFAPREIRLTRSLSRWMALDLLPLNPYIGQGLNSADDGPTNGQRAGLLALAFGLDFLTGAAYTLPSTVQAVLTPAP